MKQTDIFYEFSHNTTYEGVFPWAVSIIPRSEVIFRECRECNAIETYPSGAFDVTLEGGSKYPDILGCGAYPFLIVAQSVINVWRGNNINCFQGYPVNITDIRSTFLQGIVEPQYFRVEIEGRCQIDLTASRVEVIKFCPECHYLETRPTVVSGRQMVIDSWDGSNLFRDQDLYPRVNLCTQKIFDIAREHRFTNFRFEQVGPTFRT